MSKGYEHGLRSKHADIRQCDSLRSRLTMCKVSTGFRLVALLVVCSALSVSFAGERHSHLPKRPPLEDSLRRFLRNFDHDETTRYVATFRDLNGDGVPEAVVYLMSRNWCGSGGCNTLILKRDRGNWKLITNVPITRPPIRILITKSNGWQNIGVWFQGGGIQPGYEAELRFDGKTYPKNPSTRPARHLFKKVEGEVLVAPTADGVPLYPSH